MFSPHTVYKWRDVFRFPSNTQRTAILGRTGSGKTQFAAWLLSHAPFHKQPYVIVDYKYDQLLNDIEGVREIGLKETPKKPGLYIVHPQPDDDEGIESFMMNIWKKERIGIYIDEGYMINKNSPGLTALLTQGRSKHIPAIVLSQRPAWLNRFILSEADYYSVFHMNDRRDQKTVEGFLPGNIDERLPDYHCRWYDVSKDKSFILQPVPDRDNILARFNERLKQKRSFI